MEQNIIQMIYAVVSFFIIVLIFIAYSAWRIKKGVNNLVSEFKEYNEEEPKDTPAVAPVVDQEKLKRQQDFERLKQEFEPAIEPQIVGAYTGA